MATPTHTATIDEFDAFVIQPENQDKRFELIGGEVVEVVSSNWSSRIAARLIRYLDTFVDDNQLGHVTSSDGGYVVGEERYIPDAAFISYARQPQPTNDAYYPQAPELAVEVISPTDREPQITVKVVNYLNAGTTVWVVYPSEKIVQVYVPGQQVQVLDEQDTLTGGDVLPGFALPLAKVFS